MKGPAVSTLQKFGDAPVLVFADHASNKIPEHLNDLGVSEDFLQTHIAWDIGAGGLATTIAKHFSGTALLCNYSRLVIDSNRDPTSSDSIPAVSDQIPIPGNQMLADSERQARLTNYFDPYHEQLESIIRDEIETEDAPFIISVHSFTRRMMGASEDRPWNIGLLWHEDEESARALMHWLNENSEWIVGDNQPYDARLFNYSIDRHVGPKGLPHLTFEIRQDMISNEVSIASTSAQLVGAIEHAMNVRRQK